ncbi:MAG: hypothetical protein COB50_04480 [Thiotrichales bacterium]|nr:MAG: hypothetical protein COB50_04480 [Thiotrichales bacterium]
MQDDDYELKFTGKALVHTAKKQTEAKIVANKSNRKLGSSVDKASKKEMAMLRQQLADQEKKQRKMNKVMLQMQKKLSRYNDDEQYVTVGGNELQVMVSRNSQNGSAKNSLVNTQKEILVLYDRQKYLDSQAQINKEQINENRNDLENNAERQRRNQKNK